MSAMAAKGCLLHVLLTGSLPTSLGVAQRHAGSQVPLQSLMEDEHQTREVDARGNPSSRQGMERIAATAGGSLIRSEKESSPTFGGLIAKRFVERDGLTHTGEAF